MTNGRVFVETNIASNTKFVLRYVVFNTNQSLDLLLLGSPVRKSCQEEYAEEANHQPQLNLRFTCFLFGLLIF